jgi:enamine deaminase RidA (YjgF/YER057c/UK114 family)
VTRAAVGGGVDNLCSRASGLERDRNRHGIASDGIEAQTEQALTNHAAVLEAVGVSMSDIVKTTVFYDVDDFSRLNEVYARSCLTPLRRGRRPPTCDCPGVC